MSLSKYLTDNMSNLLLGGALAASIYVLIGPTFATKKRSSAVPGLVNIGNTCFINSVLQALASCPTFMVWLETITARDARCLARRQVTKKLLEIMRILNNMSNSNSVSDVHNPGELVSSLQCHGWRINYEEQDAHEMLHVLMTTVEEEIPVQSKNKKASHASLLDISHIGDDDDDSTEEDIIDAQINDNHRLFQRGMSLPPESRSRRSMPRGTRDTVSMSRDSSPKNSSRRGSGIFTKMGQELPISSNSSFATSLNQSPFSGLLTSKLSYKNGKNTPVNYIKFDNITLSLPQYGSGQTVSLKTLLGLYVCQETVESDMKENFVKQISFGRLPDCLCFHIQRTGYARGQAYKRHDFVDFPKILDMESYTHSSLTRRMKSFENIYKNNQFSSNQNSQNLYKLVAVVVHSGGINSGHYITYRKGPIGGKAASKWFYTSDNSVRQVSFDEVSKSSAYMLFYEKRVEDNNSMELT